MFKISIHLISLLMLFSCNSPKNNEQSETNLSLLYLLVGSYSVPDAEGLHVYTFDEENGSSSHVSSLKGISNPSYLQPSANGEFVYVVAEDDNENAAANALSFDKSTGRLQFLNTQKTTGRAPCYINVAQDSRFVVTANYTGGNISVFPLNEAGLLQEATQIINFTGHGPDGDRQSAPHLHCVVFSPDQKYLYGVDLGTDAIHFFEINKTDDTKEFLISKPPYIYELEAGSGPRHLTFHPRKPFAYLINELSGMVTAFNYANGELIPFQYIPSDTVNARGSADIHITPDGKYLYASNRLKADGLAIFNIDNETGSLTRIGYQETGIHPRNFIITPNGNYLLVACRDSNTIQIFKIDKETGLLQDTHQIIQVNKPVCLKFIE